MNNLEFLTIQERIELYKKNMAFSPSDAARKVLSLAETGMSELIDDDKFLKEEAKSKRGCPSVMYKVFCGRLSAAVSKELCKTNKTPYESRFGNNYSDYIYIAALSLASLPARLENEYDDYKPSIYYNLRMTLGNYLDALVDISCDSEKGKPDTRRANQYRKLKKELSKIIDLSTPLCKAIGILLGQYSNSHVELDRLSHIQRCKADLDYKLQMDEMREEYLDYEEDPWPDDPDNFWADDEDDTDITPVAFVTDDDFGDGFGICCTPDYEDDYDEEIEEEYDDDDNFNDDDLDDDSSPEDIELKDKESLLDFRPSIYYLSEARKLPGISVQSSVRLYAMGNENPNLLADNDYSPEGFKARIDAAELPPEFREVANEVITPDNIASAFKGMDAATDKLYRLLIEPFVEIEKYRFDRHLANDT